MRMKKMSSPASSENNKTTEMKEKIIPKIDDINHKLEAKKAKLMSTDSAPSKEPNKILLAAAPAITNLAVSEGLKLIWKSRFPDHHVPDIKNSDTKLTELITFTVINSVLTALSSRFCVRTLHKLAQRRK